MQQVLLLSRNNGNGGARDPRVIEGVLSNLDLFRDATPRNISEVASHSRTQYVRRGAVICRRGEHLPGVIVIAYGQVKLALSRADCEERVVRFLGANETFGAECVFLDRPCPVDIVALADSMLAVIPAKPLLRLLEFDPRFAHNLVQALARSVLGLVAEVEAIVQRSAMQRLASYLGSLAHLTQASATGTVRLPASKTLVAARLGITKETMSRLLRALVNQGLISVTGREILLLDRTRLELIAT